MIGSDVLAVVAAERDLVGGLSGLVDRLGLLGVESKALLAIEGNADSLVVHETGMLRKKKEKECQPGSGNPYPCPLRVRPCRTLREFSLTKFRGSRENWTPPACLRLTRKALLLPGFGGLELFCTLQTPFSWSLLLDLTMENIRTISQTRSGETLGRAILTGWDRKES